MTALATLRAQYDAAHARAVAARVPESDLAPATEPVTTSGWYAQPTVSGRPAWCRVWVGARTSWPQGEVTNSTGVITYDPDAEDELDRIAIDLYDAMRVVP